MKKRFAAIMLCAALLSGCAGQTETPLPEAEQTTASPAATTPEETAPQTTASEPLPENTEQTTASSAATTPEETTAQTTVTETAPETAPAETPAEPDVKEYDKVVALTFDDGPNTTTTYEVLEVLKKHDVVASFFLVGNNINDESAKAVKYAYDLGCEIDNHSKTHGYMNEMSAEECAAEVKYVDDKVYEITGEHTKFFRPPYLAICDQMWDYIDIPFIAGVGCDDWNPKVTTERRVAYIEKKAQNGGLDGCVILMHDAAGNDQTVAAIDEIIPALKEMGYRFVTVSELFAEKGVAPAELILYTDVEQTGMWS